VQDPDVPDMKYTEAGMNGFGEGELPKRFETAGYHVLIVADKYQTGFDQPLLHTMYVDKKLSGVRAVQTLSRLNRTHPEKEDTFVLDFANEAVDIRAAFAPYYELTTAEESAGPDQLYDLQHRLETSQVVSRDEVESFATVFYSQKKDLTGADNKAMNAIVDRARARFDALTEDGQNDFRDAIGSYVSLYSFLSQIMQFGDSDLEKLYAYARKLEAKLPHDARKPLALQKDVALKSYRNQLQFEGSITLSLAEPVALRGIKGEGARKKGDEEARLSEIIEIWNERFKTEFTKADELFIEQVIEEAQRDERVAEKARANTEENFALAMAPVIEKKMVDRIDRHHEIVDHYLNDKPFQETAFQAMVKRIYHGIRRASAEGSTPPPSGT
jgi:type I restriction enzyme R subunit